MPTYRVRPARLYWDDDRPFLPDLTVYDREEPEKTGLVDQWGNDIVRVSDQPIGFHTIKEGST
jgi:hypothetical protein